MRCRCVHSVTSFRGYVPGLAVPAANCSIRENCMLSALQTSRPFTVDKPTWPILPHIHLRRLRPVLCQAAAPQSTKIDSSMMWGDIMMLTATELASERLPKQVTGVLSLTLLAAWIGVILSCICKFGYGREVMMVPVLQVAAAKGDYTVKRQHTPSYQYAYTILLGMQQAAITWVSVEGC